MNIRKGLTPAGMRVAAILSIAVTLGSTATLVIGCDDNNRVPTKDEVQKADVKRQSYVDSLNISDEQKAQMKAHMGGPPAGSPAAAAQQNAPKDRR